MNEIKVGDWTVTQHKIDRLEDLSVRSRIARKVAERTCRECCEILSIDPTTDSVARDIAEEIVLHGTPVDEVIAKLQRHLEATQ
jgi:RNase P subunit RPR2